MNDAWLTKHPVLFTRSALPPLVRGLERTFAGKVYCCAWGEFIAECNGVVMLSYDPATPQIHTAVAFLKGETVTPKIPGVDEPGEVRIADVWYTHRDPSCAIAEADQLLSEEDTLFYDVFAAVG